MQIDLNPQRLDQPPVKIFFSMKKNNKIKGDVLNL